MLKLTAVTLFKHGLGHFERSGAAGASFELPLARRAMDDVLKSLIILPSGKATVQGIAFDTPDDRNVTAQRQPVALPQSTPLSGLIAAFSGSRVRVVTADAIVEGGLIGLEREDESHLKRALLAIATANGVALLPLASVTSIDLADAEANADLRHALAHRRRDNDRSHARVRLSAPSDVMVSYIAPAPAWRASYRVMIDRAIDDQEEHEVVLQGWGLFDNTLDEDIDGVRLTLTAGMPVSFRYALHQPHTPDRPLVVDDERTVAAPIEFDARSFAADDHVTASVGAPGMAMMKRAGPHRAAVISESAPSQATPSARGALFAYAIDAPVSVRRGESAMVPIVAIKTRGERTLMFNAAKQEAHPVVSVRLKAEGVTLERGPAVVMDSGHYAGEAVVPFTTADSELILAFAVELGIRVSRSVSHREATVRLSFRDRNLFIDVVHYTTTTYEAVSALAAPQRLLVEHMQSHGSRFETPPIEDVLDYGRFQLPVPARGTARLSVVEKRLVQSYQDVTGITGRALQAFLADKLLDAKTVAALDAILADEANAVTLEAQRRGIDGQRKGVRQRMDDLHKHIGALTTPAESSLRARFVTQLEALEDQMQAFDNTERDIAARIDALKQAIDTAARALSTVASDARSIA